MLFIANAYLDALCKKSHHSFWGQKIKINNIDSKIYHVPTILGHPVVLGAFSSTGIVLYYCMPITQSWEDLLLVVPLGIIKFRLRCTPVKTKGTTMEFSMSF